MYRKLSGTSLGSTHDPYEAYVWNDSWLLCDNFVLYNYRTFGLQLLSLYS